MQELNKYYEENICSYCSNFGKGNCSKNFTKKEANNVKTIICQSYKKNTQDDLDNNEKPEEVYALPARYYIKNFKEI